MSKISIAQLSHPQRVRILYKTVLRLHRGLPEELRELGNNYARDEWRRHLKCQPSEAHIFMTEWAKYAVTLSEQLGLKGKAKGKLGDTLDHDAVEKLSDQQTVQLYELMVAAKGLDNDVTELTSEEIGTNKTK